MSKEVDNSCICIYFESFRKRPSGLSENNMENIIKKIYTITEENHIEVKESHIKTSPDKNLSFIYFVINKDQEMEFVNQLNYYRSKIGFNKFFSVKPGILTKQKQQEKKAAIREKQILPGDKVMILEGEFTDMFAQVDSINAEEKTLVVKITTFSNVFCYETLEIHQIRKLSNKELSS